MSARFRPFETEPRHRLGERGLTLLELLVALSIFAILGAALFPVVGGALRGRRDASERLETLDEARAILDRLEQDLAGTIDPGVPPTELPRLVAPEESARTSNADTLVELTTVLARGVSAPEAPLPGEAAAAAPERGDQARVRWALDGDGRLLRRETRPPARGVLDWTGVPAEEMSTRASVTLEFRDEGTWLPSWDSAKQGRSRRGAPLAVRITLRLDDGSPDGFELVSTALMPEVDTATAGQGEGRPEQRSPKPQSGSDGSSNAPSASSSASPSGASGSQGSQGGGSR